MQQINAAIQPNNIPITLQYNIARLLGQVAVYAKVFWPLTRIWNQNCPSLTKLGKLPVKKVYLIINN